MGVRLGVVFSSLPTAASLISAILHYLCVCLFDVPLLLFLPLSAHALQGGALLAAGRIAAAAVQLIPVIVVLASVINAPLPLPSPPGTLAVAASPVSGRILDIVATRGLVPQPPREHATWAWAMGKEGGNVLPRHSPLLLHCNSGDVCGAASGADATAAAATMSSSSVIISSPQMSQQQWRRRKKRKRRRKRMRRRKRAIFLPHSNQV
jgi:hypothetical protein